MRVAMLSGLQGPRLVLRAFTSLQHLIFKPTVMESDCLEVINVLRNDQNGRAAAASVAADIMGLLPALPSCCS